jgi:hypothetical protein
VLGPEINAGVHGFSALFEVVLWTDPERVDDWLRTRKSVFLRELSFLHDIYGQTLGL